jgi:pimeloyl-ACP methyl ester carboxylesterase
MKFGQCSVSLLACLLGVACQDQQPPTGPASDRQPRTLLSETPAPIPPGAVADCRPQTIPVALGPGQPEQYEIFGELCLPLGVNPLGVQTVHVVVHGATYSHLYWEWPFQPERYSYADALTRAGYAVFTFDRIGVGRSSHPPSDAVTLDANAFVTHQLIEGLRDGRIGHGTRFQRVVLVGHSLGSSTSLLEASTYHDVDGVILTGFLHQFYPPWLFLAFTSFYPANADPKFAGQGLDPGYFTTIPGTRDDLFYNLPNADPAVVALDEKTKETATIGEQNTLESALAPAVSQAVHVPVLLLDGQFDNAFCGPSLCPDAAAVAQLETPFFAVGACLQTVVIPATGHDLNLHITAPTTYEAIRIWSDAYVGRDNPAPACQSVASQSVRR